MKKNISIKEISKKCNLSVATISRAMNSDTRYLVKKQTIDLIDKVTKKYAYTPNKIGQMLRKNKTNTLGILLPYDQNIFKHGYFTELMSGIIAYLEKLNYDLKILTPDINVSIKNLCTDNVIDGLIVLNWQSYSDFIKAVQNKEKINNKILLANNYRLDFNASGLYIDNELWAYKAVEYLIKKGCKKIAHIKGSVGSFDGEARYKGYLKALKQNNMLNDKKGLFEIGHFSKELAFNAVKKLLERVSDIDGIFCANDIMAIGVLQYLRKMKISVPKNIKLIGFDGLNIGEIITPSLTTISIDLFNYGKKLAEELILLIKNKDNNYHKIKYEPILIEREST